MGKIAKVIFVPILCCLIAGCTDMRILEDQGMIQAISYDMATKDKGSDIALIKVTAAIPLIQKDNLQKIIESTATSSKDARIEFSSQTDLELVNGQLRTVLFGKNIAKQGVINHFDTILRDPTIGLRSNIIIVNGNAAKMLAENYQEQEPTYEFLDRLIEKQVDENIIPDIDIFQFMRDVKDDGIDPVAPQFIQRKNHIDTDGVALFRGERYVTKIDASKGTLFSILNKKMINNGQLNFDWPASQQGDAEFAALDINNSRRHINVYSSPGSNQFTVDISIKVKGSITEYIGTKNLDNKKYRDGLGEKMAESLEKQTQELVIFTQKHSVDSIGIGKYVRNSISYNEWKNLDWRKVYPAIQVHCSAEVEIRDYGLIH